MLQSPKENPIAQNLLGLDEITPTELLDRLQLQMAQKPAF
jgi:hypothetical protein